MSQIFFVHKNSARFSELMQNLTQDAGMEISEFSSVDKIIPLIPLFPALELIVISAIEDIALLEDFLIRNQSKLIVMVLGKIQIKRSETIQLSSSISNDDLQNKIQELLSNKLHQTMLANLPDFFPIDFSFVKAHASTAFPVDFYLKIKKTATEFQFVKKLHANDLFSPEDLKRFTDHHIKNLYVSKKQYPTWLKTIIKIIENKNVSPSNEEQKKSFYLTQELLSFVGIDKEVVEFVKTNI